MSDERLAELSTVTAEGALITSSARPRSCPTHPSYATGRPPTRDCITCWAAYGRRRAIDDGLRSAGRKMKKPNGRASKAKGKQLIDALRDTLLAAAPWLEPADVLSKATSMGGVDLHLSPRAMEWFSYGIEGKNTESLNIWAALKQSADNAAGKTPLVVFKRAGSAIYVALRLEDFLQLHPWPKNLPTPLTPSTPPAPTL